MHRFIAGISVLMLLSICSTVPAYQNPLGRVAGSTISEISNLADPYILKHEGTYYLYGTVGSAVGSSDVGFRCWQSTDLLNWRPMGWVFTGSSTTWSHYAFFDPEVHYRNGKFYLLFAARHTYQGPLNICLAVADSPLGPFVEYRAPLVGMNFELGPHLFVDTDDRVYLYWTVFGGAGSGIFAQEMASDLSGFVGSVQRNVLGFPSQPWEVNQGYMINEGPFIIKHDGMYYMQYSGNSYELSKYGVGYATSTSPLGPFVKYSGNPILKSDMTATPRISGPGSGSITTSPDGTETFMVYHAHTYPERGGNDRQIYIDRLTFENGIMKVLGPTNTPQPEPSGSTAQTVTGDTFTTNNLQPFGAPTGWSLFVYATNPGLATAYYDEVHQSYVAKIMPHPYTYRIAGVLANEGEWLKYRDIGPDKYVRAKFYMYSRGQNNPSNLNEVPNFQLRAAFRFAYSGFTEVFHHMNELQPWMPTSTELRPSTDPDRPSLYRMDLDPVDVPYLQENADTEGIMGGFVAFCVEPQENGELAMAEHSLSVYPASLLPDADTPDILKKVYTPGLNDAGNMRRFNAHEVAIMNYTLPNTYGDWYMEDPSGTPRPTYHEGGILSVDPPPGVTLDTSLVPSDRLGYISKEFNPDGGTNNHALRLRVEPDKQYKIRFHVTSPLQTTETCGLWMRAGSVGHAWNHYVELTGPHAYTTIAPDTYICRQTLPGVDTMNPDRVANENGGWYTVMFHSPLQTEIRPEFPDGTPIGQRMPNIAGQPGPGVNQFSLRDLKVMVDVFDTLDEGAQRGIEKGRFTIDRIEIREYNRVPD